MADDTGYMSFLHTIANRFLRQSNSKFTAENAENAEITDMNQTDCFERQDAKQSRGSRIKKESFSGWVANNRVLNMLCFFIHDSIDVFFTFASCMFYCTLFYGLALSSPV